MRAINRQVPGVQARRASRFSGRQRSTAVPLPPAVSRLFYRSRPPEGGQSRPANLPRRSRLEAVLFVAREPLGLRKLAQLANLTDGTEVRTLIGESF